MPRLSKTQEGARRRIAHLATLGLSPEPLAARLVAALAIAIPHDGFRLFGVDPGSLLVNRLLAASASDGWARLEWLREVYLAADPLPYLELPFLMRANLPAVAFQARQDACWGYPPASFGGVSPRDHHRFFHELRNPVGGTLLAGFAAAGRWVAALQAYRRDPARPFRPTDVAFLHLIAPTAGAALAAAIAREQAASADADAFPRSMAPGSSGVLLLDADGRPRFGTPAGEAWCGLLNDADRSAHAPVPSAVWSALAALRAGGPDNPAGVVLAPTPHGQVRVEASPAGPDGTVAVVLAPAGPPAPPTVPAAWPLTRQERRIVAPLLRGLSNRQIAATLSVTEHTVEWHLRHVYEKLGVRSRGQLTARFFRETHLPALTPDDA